jgi:hypothetical protein
LAEQRGRESFCSNKDSRPLCIADVSARNAIVVDDNGVKSRNILISWRENTMFPFLLLLAGLLLVAAIVAAILIVVNAAYTLLVEVPAVRRREWVNPNPPIVPLTDEAASPLIRILASQFGPLLIAEGFERVAGVHAPEFSGAGGWTQILYLNRKTGERASIMQLALSVENNANLFIASEFDASVTVLTGLPERTVFVDDDLSDLFPDLIARHRRRVREVMCRDPLDPVPRGKLPEAGREFEWLTTRMRPVAEETTRLKYRFHAERGLFVLPWGEVIRLAFRRRQRSEARRGFEVLNLAEGNAAPAPNVG